MTSNFQEKRREPRLPAAGLVSFHPIDAPSSQSVHGRLIDTSLHGFRAAHSSPGLVSGQEVLFSHSGASGRARVAWNRILAGAVETGFYILAP